MCGILCNSYDRDVSQEDLAVYKGGETNGEIFCSKYLPTGLVLLLKNTTKALTFTVKALDAKILCK